MIQPDHSKYEAPGLRAGRGSQQGLGVEINPGGYRKRPASGLGEDRNRIGDVLELARRRKRPASGLGEDRNYQGRENPELFTQAKRPASGLGEDRNNLQAQGTDGVGVVRKRPASVWAEDRQPLAPPTAGH